MKGIEIIVSHRKLNDAHEIPKDVNTGAFAGLGEGEEPGRAGSDAAHRGVRWVQDAGSIIDYVYHILRW
jgi:hypothetical protein